MDKTSKFKIDLYHGLFCSVGLYHRRTFFGIPYWKRVTVGTTREEMLSAYQEVKDLPEYLA